MTDDLRTGAPAAVHVRLADAGSWWVVDLDGQALSQWPSEFAAIDAGRINARRLDLPLIIHDASGSRTEQPPPGGGPY